MLHTPIFIALATASSSTRASNSSRLPFMGFVSVSYTHLDVYKRQSIYRVVDIISQSLNRCSLGYVRKSSHTSKLFLPCLFQNHYRITVLVISENNMVYVSCYCFAHSFAPVIEKRCCVAAPLLFYSIFAITSAYFPVPTAATNIAS